MGKTKSLAASAGVVVLMAGAGCSVSTGPDEIGLEYDSGAFSDTTFDSCVKPNNRQYYGPGDQAFVYPGGQRTYQFAPGDKGDAKPATVVSNDDLELTSSGVVTFTLNPSCDVLKNFHERIGLKYSAHTDAGWAELLDTYIREPLNRALDDATKKYAWRDLYTDADTKSDWEKEVAELLSKYIEEQGGGAFFCAPTFTGAKDQKCGSPQLTLQQPVPPKDVRNALTKAQEAVELTRAQEEENKRVEKELEAIEALVDVLGPDGYAVYKAIEEGDVKILPVPQGGEVSVRDE